MSQEPLTQDERAPLVTDAIPPALRRRGVTRRQVLAAIAAGALVLALFASRDAPGWAERLGDAPFAHKTRAIAGSWDRAMESLGFTRLHEALRAAMQRALDWPWPSKKKGDTNFRISSNERIVWPKGRV